MSVSKKQTTGGPMPYLQDLHSLYKHLKANPPLNKDFDVREIDPEVLGNYSYTQWWFLEKAFKKAGALF